jgi:hypothetical protein
MLIFNCFPYNLLFYSLLVFGFSSSFYMYSPPSVFLSFCLLRTLLYCFSNLLVYFLRSLFLFFSARSPVFLFFFSLFYFYFFRSKFFFFFFWFIYCFLAPVFLFTRCLESGPVCLFYLAQFFPIYLGFIFVLFSIVC